MPNPKSKIVIRVQKFRPVGAMTTMSVAMDLLDRNNGTPIAPPNPLPANWFPNDGDVTMLGSYFLKSKRGNGPLDLEFWLLDETGDFVDPTDVSDEAEIKRWSRFRFLGISFSNRNQAEYVDPQVTGEARGVGAHVFEKITLTKGRAPISSTNPAPYGSVMTIRNNRNHAPGTKESYDYMIYIQDTKSGDVGSIDPEYENET